MMKDHEIKELYGYTGKILRVNLTDSTTSIVPTTKYVPRWIGGEAVSTAIYWDEMKQGVGAFDPENKLIFMTGAPCGSGMPASNRLSVCGISPNSLPEQFTHSNMGGFFSGMLKFAGYDGIIIEGKAPKHTYIYIEDEKVEFLDADDFIWGEFVHETQDKIYEKHGKDAHSVVIGPAGEHLHRNGSITTGNDNASAKAGFGAVMGSKNLKAITVKGTGEVRTAHPEKVLELHKTVGYPNKGPNPYKFGHTYGGGVMSAHSDEGVYTAKLCCGYGCNIVCMNTTFEVPDVLHPGERKAEVIKCIDVAAYNLNQDVPRGDWNNIHSRAQEKPRNEVYDQMTVHPDYPPTPVKATFKGSYQYNKLRRNDESDPYLKDILTQYTGDMVNYYGPNYLRGAALTVLCNQYGIDKWDVMVWYMTWLSMAKQEGIIKDFDFGMEVDLDNVEFIKHFMHMMAYREGELGNDLAEGMARFIRKYGKEKYGDSIYHNRYDMTGTKQLDLPISLEAGWGHCSHYQGRGFEGTPKYAWVIYSLLCMADSRDCVCNHHIHDWVESYVQYKDDPCHVPQMAKQVVKDEIYGMLKDSLVTCEWKSPNPGWETMESEMYNAVTGLDVTEEELWEAADAANVLYRAVLMRNHGRCRDMESVEPFPFMRYPDPYGDSCTWEEWNDAVDLYYNERGYDLETGWPTRSTWEKHGLGDVADEMERLGKLPPEGRTEYTRKPGPVPDDYRQAANQE